MINTELFQETMEKIRKRLSSEKEVLVTNNVSTDGVSEGESIDNLIKKSSDTTFKLLVMGRFSSGKSAFVNVLLGEKILPEKALPSTALITEIYYGKEKKVIMYPRKGKWQGGNEPFEIEPALSEIAKYSTINNNAGLNTKEANRLDSCFEKMVVYWPLEMLKDGVSIIDSPGTDDPYSNDYIVESYVPKADAILYCVAGTQAYNALDKNTLERINSMGFKNPIITTTYFDVVTDGMNDEEKNEFIDVTFKNFYSRHTSKECCHYVNSRLGLTSKQNGSHADFVESGYNELEKFLGEYLTEYKGKEKIAGITSMVDAFNNNQIKSINGIIEGLDTPLDDFNKKIDEKNKALEQAKLQGNLIMREFKVEAKPAKEEIKELVPDLFDRLYENINLDGFEPDTNFSIWSPKKSSTQIAEECSKEIEIRNKDITAEWNNQVLTPKITEAFKTIASRMQNQFDAFSSDINKASVTISSNNEAVDTGVKTSTRIGMFAYALFTGDWITALTGGIFGAGTFGRSLLCQFAAGMVLGIVALFTPIGIPALVIASLAGLMTSIGWTAAKASESIKKKTVKAVREKLLQKKDSIIENATIQCLKVFDTVEEKLKKAVDDDIKEAKQNIEKAKKEREENADKIEERKISLSGVIEFLKETSSHMADIKKEFNI